MGRVWTGNRALRPYLVAADTLRPHPRNPRLGNVYEIGRSLDRYGQQRPILATPDGTIVAGHHVYKAATQRDWTHVAAVLTDLTDDQIDAYLLADNGTADRGWYDEAELAALLQQWSDYDGTGFAAEDAQAIIRAMLWMPDDLQAAPTAGSPREQPLARGEAEAFNMILTYDDETYERVAAGCERLMAKHNVTTYAEAVRSEILGGT